MVAAAVLTRLEIDPFWSAVPVLLAVLALGVLWAATNMLERAAGAAWLRNQERETAASLPDAAPSKEQLQKILDDWSTKAKETSPAAAGDESA